MLATEYPYNGNDKLIRFYSDAGFTVRQIETGIEYGEAIDLYPPRYTFEETDNPIEPEEEEND